MAVKKKVRPGAILLSDTEKALVVEYEQEDYQVLDDGSVGELLNKSKGSKKLKVRSVSATTDLDALANELMEKCKLIKPSSLPAVKVLLARLREREASAAAAERPAHVPGTGAEASTSAAGEVQSIGSARQGSSDAAGDPGSKSGSKEKRRSRKEKMSSAS
jgi:Kinesin-associated protein (KAP)